MLSNLVTEVILHDRIQTTLAKARETRPLVEKMVTLAKRGGLHARRQALRVVKDRSVVKKLFDELGPLYATRPGGYTRIIKLGNRAGDNASMSLLELVDRVQAPVEKKKAATEEKVEAPEEVAVVEAEETETEAAAVEEAPAEAITEEPETAQEPESERKKAKAGKKKKTKAPAEEKPKEEPEAAAEPDERDETPEEVAADSPAADAAAGKTEPKKDETEAPAADESTESGEPEEGAGEKGTAEPEEKKSGES
jgi:large subunit ribosomal protein L17